MSRASMIILALGLFSPGDAGAGDISVIAGEPALLDVLRDAQRAKAGAFPHGEMRVVAEKGRLGHEPADRRVEALVKWDGDECHATGTIAEYMEEDRRTATQAFDVLYNKKRRIFHLPDVQLMRISAVQEGKYPPMTRLRPDEWWYGNIDGGGSTKAEQLDGFVRMPTDTLRHCRVRRLGTDQVEVSRDGGGEVPGRFRTLFSLSQDGNVIQEESFDPSSGFREERGYTWERAKGGGWYPKAVQITRHFPPRPPSTDVGAVFRYEVHSFDATVRPPKSTFADSAIRPPPGTYVEDDKSGKRVRVGDTKADSVIDSLNGLTKDVKGRGFGARPK